MRFIAPSIGAWFTRMRRAALAFGLGVVLVAGGVRGVIAQEPLGDVIPPEECTTAPLPPDFLATYIATPISATPVARWTGLPEGTEPDEQTRAEITEVVRQLTACSNTGDILRGLALFAPEYLRRTLNAQGILTPEQAIALVEPFATPLAITPEMMIRLVEIRDLRLMADGRVAAVTVTVPLGGVGLDTDLLIFARTADGWIIDDAVSDWDVIEAMATPAA